MNMVPPEIRSQLEGLLSQFNTDGELPDGEDLPDGVSDALNDLTGGDGGEAEGGDKADTGGDADPGDTGDQPAPDTDDGTDDKPSDEQDTAGEGKDEGGRGAGPRGNRRGSQRGPRDRNPGGGS
jgi:hypothetical protein